MKQGIQSGIGKGDRNRTTNVKAYRDNYSEIFGNKKKSVTCADKNKRCVRFADGVCVNCEQ